MSALLASALEFAHQGMSVFPLHYPVESEGRLRCSCGDPHCKNAAKHPYARHAPKGLLSATADPTLIERWWGPGVPYNIGLRTGRESGIVVIDVDPRHDGDARLVEHERRFGALPETWHFLTGGGGEHIVFRHPGGRVQNSAGGTGPLGDGLDVRGDGGYIVAPPSQHISGRHYAIATDQHPDDVPLAELPVWLMAMIAEPARSNGGERAAAMLPESWRRLIAEGVTEGRRNDAIARLAGLLLCKKIDPFVALDLCHCWNACRCKPSLADAEVVRTVESIAGREIESRGRTS